MGFTLTFGSVASSTYSVEALDKPTMLGQAARDVSFVSVPGRNGTVAIDNGRWAEFTESYIIHGALDDVEAFRADLAALEGAEEELTDSFDTTHLRLGRFVDAFSLSRSDPSSCTATLNFLCRPERFLKSAWAYTSISNGDTLTNPTLFTAKPAIKGTGSGTISIAGKTMTITGYSGSWLIDCDTLDVTSQDGLTNLNQYASGDFPEIPAGSNTVTITGATSVSIMPRYWTL